LQRVGKCRIQEAGSSKQMKLLLILAALALARAEVKLGGNEEQNQYVELTKLFRSDAR
jgi:5-enolpyruvylshikimate-3-phosphate synthase